MKILIVNGYPRSGKDSFCDFACENRPLVFTYSTITKVKEIAKTLGWDGNKDDKGRKFLSSLKDCLTEYNDFPTQFILSEIKQKLELIKGSDEAIFLIQMREPEEIERWRDDFCARAVYIGRPNILSYYGNHADDNVIYGEYDYTLENDSTLWDWKKKTFEFIDEIRQEKWESNI